MTGAASIVWLDSVDSTNEEAKRRAQAGEAAPVWIAARRQTAGRGRRGRAWDSASGNLFCTLLLRPDCDPARCAQLAFAAGLAAAETADCWVAAEDVRLKWPNDVLVAGHKAAGCLLEMGGDGQGRWLAIGVGMNLVSAPPGTLYPATHLSAHLKAGAPPPASEVVLDRLARAFARWFEVWERTGFMPLREAFLARAANLGEPVTARLADGSEQVGVFEDLDISGALVLRRSDGRRLTVAAGDVFFPPPA